jgi:hypothetical protein
MPIRLPSGSVKCATTRVPGGSLGAHLALPAEGLGLLERGLDVGNAHVEHDAGLVARAAADAAVDAAARRAAVDEPVVAGRGDGLGRGVAGLELPTEQVAEEAAELRRVLPDDLEVDDWSPCWLRHGGSFRSIGV